MAGAVREESAQSPTKRLSRLTPQDAQEEDTRTAFSPNEKEFEVAGEECHRNSPSTKRRFSHFPLEHAQVPDHKDTSKQGQVGDVTVAKAGKTILCPAWKKSQHREAGHLEARLDGPWASTSTRPPSSHLPTAPSRRLTQDDRGLLDSRKDSALLQAKLSLNPQAIDDIHRQRDNTDTHEGPPPLESLESSLEDGRRSSSQRLRCGTRSLLSCLE